MDTTMRKGLSFSLLGHLAIVLLFVVPKIFFEEELFVPESIIRVDLVGLPMKEQKIPAAPKDDQVEASPEPPSTVAPAAPEKPAPSKSPARNPRANNQQKQGQALNRLKQMDALEKLAAIERRQAVLGNEISTGNQLTGLAKLEAASYIQEVEKHVKDNWIIPKWLAEKGYRAQIQVRFDETGQILEIVIKKPSGNRNFDEIAIQTLRNSVPFPKPPDRLVKQMQAIGILFGFPD